MKSRALREARLGRMWTQEQAAKVAGVGVRTVREYEANDPLARLATIEFLAKALGVEPRAIARPVDDDDAVKAKATAGSAKSTGAAPVPLPPSPGTTQLPKPSRLEELVALERKHPRPPLRGTAWGDLPPLGAKLYQDVFTAFRIHEGERAHLVGRVEAQRGITRGEAGILGTKTGIGARFHVITEIAPGHVMGVTVHAASVTATNRLQGLVGMEAHVVLRVVVVPDETFDKGVGLAFFFVPETPRPWCLVVDEVMEEVMIDRGPSETTQPKKKRKSARASTRGA